MPELTKSSVGSSRASSGADGTRVWPRSSKKRWKRSRISAALIGCIGPPVVHTTRAGDRTGSRAARSRSRFGAVYETAPSGAARVGVVLGDHLGARLLGGGRPRSPHRRARRAWSSTNSPTARGTPRRSAAPGSARGPRRSARRSRRRPGSCRIQNPSCVDESSRVSTDSTGRGHGPSRRGGHGHRLQACAGGSSSGR